MDEKVIPEVLLEILCAAINGEGSSPSLIQKVERVDLVDLYRLAKKHDLAHIVSEFVCKNKVEIDNEELRDRMQRENLLSVYRHERMQRAFEQICICFDDARIAYVPLKGAVIKAYYPCAHMRTSCDIDILIHEEDMECAIECLEKRGYRCEKKNYHDVSLYSPNKTHLELHFNIQENMDSLDMVLKDAWKHTKLVQGSRYEFSKEFFVFHMYAHMAYHFLSGGCGVRALLDVWVMEHRMDAHYACAEDLLKQAGIDTFAREMCSIANKCFSLDEKDAFSDLVLQYIFRGGVYGTKDNRIAVKKGEAGNAFLYALKRLFLPYRSMVILYPVLKKLPLLLPICWVARCASAVLKGKGKRIASELERVNDISDDTLSELAEIRSRLGL